MYKNRIEFHLYQVIDALVQKTYQRLWPRAGKAGQMRVSVFHIKPLSLADI